MQETISTFIIPNYSIQELLSRNLQKKVAIFSAIRSSDQQKVAIKTPLDENPSFKDLADLNHEFQILKKVQISEAVHVFDLINFKNTQYLIMEFLDGKRLQTFIKENKRLDLKTFLNIALQLTHILNKLHRAKIVHKDFNSMNLMINPHTLQVKIIGFGLSSELSTEMPPSMLEGTLAYISPEQTGKMNRVIDYRSDFYSLGVTFFEMLAGTLPFKSADPLEFIYYHMTKNPPEIKGIPPILNQLIRKLMAKNAEERYSSALGIQKDLLKIQQGETDFILGQEDRKNILLISQKLYGREEQIKSILSKFENFIRTSQSELLLVKGPSGMGKTSLINEVQKPLVSCKGIFIQGKYDILRKSEPYFGLSQALKELIYFLLSQENIETIKLSLQEAIGNTGLALASVIPQMDLLLTHLPPLEPLPPKEAQNRLHLSFERFFKVIATKDHPLVIFLDDLQGIEQASMDLIHYLLETTPYLFFIGAYRDNEVSPLHPLIASLKETQHTTLTLNPLSQTHIETLLRDTFEIENVEELAEQVFLKTSGNPFFINEFLKRLYQKEWIVSDERGWTFDLIAIKEAKMTDNVLELMFQKIHNLSKPCQEVICIAAFIGGTFSLKILSLITEKSKELLSEILWEGMQEGLIFTKGTDYKKAKIGENILYYFLHDKIQEAAYELIQTDKAPIHLQIGRILLKQEESSLFDVIDNFNRALPLICDSEEQKKVAFLNLDGAKKAKSSNAYAAALNYLEAARKLIGKNHFELEKEYGETLSLLGRFEEANTHLIALIPKAPNILEKMRIYSALAAQNCNTGNLQEAIQNSIDGLKLMGIYLKPKPTFLNILGSFFRFQFSLFLKGTERLKNIPQDPLIDELDHLTGSMSAACYIANEPNLFMVLTFNMLLKYLQLGVSAGSSYNGYIIMLMTLNQFKNAVKWQDLALLDVSQRHSSFLEGRTMYIYGTFYVPWFKHIKETLAVFNKTIQLNLEAGDFTYLAFSQFQKALYCFLCGHSCSEIDEEFQKACHILQRTKEDHLEASLIIQSFGNSLAKGKKAILKEKLTKALEKPFKTTVRHWISAIYSGLLIVNQEFEEAFHMAKTGLLYAESTKPQAIQAYAAYFYALAAYNIYHKLTPHDKKNLKKALKNIKIWADQCSVNYLPLYLHLSAEKAALEGNKAEASSFFNRALDVAEEGEFYFYAAMISEGAFRFYLKIHEIRLAKSYLQLAHYHYSKFGALDIAKKLEEKYPNWLSPQEKSSPTLSLDFLSVLKATQILSSEIILNQLLEKMIQVVKQNAGAEKVVFLSIQKDKFLIEVEGLPDDQIKLYKDKFIDESQFPISLLNYVLRSKQHIVLDDASSHPGQFYQDPYFKQNSIKSVLCTPILYQSNVLGLLYLENNVAHNAFTKERIQILNVLASQAAISLENARMYRASGRFVPNQFLKELGKRSLVDVRLGDQVPRKMSVLVCDIRNFTTLSENMSSHETFAFINNFLGQMEPIIRAHQGFIDKYIGDAIMALFPNKCEDALNAAIEMLQNLPQGIELGIGINTGDLMLGILGGEERIDSSVIGDTVNTAFRVESLTKQYKVPLLITDYTKQALKPTSNYHFSEIGSVNVKGKKQPVLIWQVIV